MGWDVGKRQLNRLSAKTVASEKRPGLHCDGGGLYLQVASSGSKAWIFRFRSPITRKTRDMGLGALHCVDLAAAREKAAVHRKAIHDALETFKACNSWARWQPPELSAKGFIWTVQKRSARWRSITTARDARPPATEKMDDASNPQPHYSPVARSPTSQISPQHAGKSHKASRWNRRPEGLWVLETQELGV
jgi:hypothetical protein